MTSHEKPIDTNGEEWRHQCEVRYVANLPNDEARRKYLDGVRKARGVEPWSRLRKDTWELIRRGSPKTAA